MFTGTSMYESWSLSMFNTLFTSLPVLCIGIFEQDLSPVTLIAVPELYYKGQQNRCFGILLYIGWITVAASHSIVVSFLTYYLFGFYTISDNSIYPLGVLSFTSIIFIICIKLQLLEMHHVTIMNWGALVISCGGWMCWNMFLQIVYKDKSAIYFVYGGLFDRFGKDLTFWGTILANIVIAVLVEVLIKLLRVRIMPNDCDKFESLERNPAVWARLEDESYEELKQGWHANDDLESGLRGFLQSKLSSNRHRGPHTSHSSRRENVNPSRRQRIMRKLATIHRGQHLTDSEIAEIFKRRGLDQDPQSSS
jgi:magnesium-transporting ATPase (P-type)